MPVNKMCFLKYNKLKAIWGVRNLISWNIVWRRAICQPEARALDYHMGEK